MDSNDSASVRGDHEPDLVPSASPRDTPSAGSAIARVLRRRNFRVFWIGQGISLLGDQFYLIALPWLVLQLTGDAFKMGTVLAVAGIPRALFMLVGGAFSDRFSPRWIMLASNLARMGVVVLLAVIVGAGAIETWMLYATALAFGLADAFFFPAQGAILPQLVDREHLQAGNAVVSGTAQLSLLVGPVLAGSIIALFSAEAGAAVPTRGIAIAFAFDAVTFAASAFTLWILRLPALATPDLPHRSRGILSSMGAGLAHVWGDSSLRIFFFMLGAISMLGGAILSVGIPVLADTRYREGAAAFGILVSGFGGGALLGTLLAGSLPRPRADRLGPTLLVAISLMGLGTVALGFAPATALGAGCTLLIGASNGYFGIQFITWVQVRTPTALLGRLMSVLMFASVGLNPVAATLAGALVELNPTALFAGGGAALTLVALLAAATPGARSMGTRAEV